MRPFVLFVLLFTIKFQLAFAETFMVTTNADSGTKSLRASMTLAAGNWTAVVYIVIFNIAYTTRAGRTITLVEELPDLNSNLIIDGSTQAGYKIGMSDAKIILLLNIKRPGVLFYFLKFELQIISKFSDCFFIKNFSRLFEFPGSPATGIRFMNSSNITIGKPGKGNYFRGVSYGIDNPEESYKRNFENISI